MKSIQLLAGVSIVCLCIYVWTSHQPAKQVTIEQQREQLINLLTGSVIARTLYSLAELKVADHITDSPKHTTIIAKAVSANPDALYRALRLAASHGIFTEGPAEHFTITSLGKLLQTQHPDSLHYVALHEDAARWQALGNLTYSLQTGEQAFKQTHGLSYFEYLALHKEASKQFDMSMASISAQENRTIAASFNFSHYPRIIDVGGGYGGLLAEIMQTHSGIMGALYDLPQVVQQTNNLLVKPSPNCTILAGSFFESVPGGYDLYMLKRIIHDWDDEQALQILKNCRAALGSAGRLLVIDAIIPSGNERHVIKEIDLLLLALFGGKERTESEFFNLFQKAGLKIIKLHKTSSLLSIFELVPATH